MLSKKIITIRPGGVYSFTDKAVGADKAIEVLIKYTM